MKKQFVRLALETAVLAVLLCLGTASAVAQVSPVSASEFAQRALPALPIEEPGDFRQIIMRDLERFHRDPDAKPTADEMAIPDNGWALVTGSGSGALLREAASDFSAYLLKAMQVHLTPQAKPSVEDWSELTNVIVAGTREQLPGCGAGLKARKDYRIMTSPHRIVVCGFDESGAMYGLYNLEDRMNLREAPYLPRRLDTVRHSLYATRMTLSGLGWMEWPDGYLRLLAHYGFDAIYAPAYYNLNGYPRKQPTGTYATIDPQRIHELIPRAAKYGIDLYSPILWLYTGEHDNELELRMLVRDVVRSFPEVRGYVLLNEGFSYVGGPSPKASAAFRRNWIENWTKAIAVVTEECHKINPAIEVLPWDYGVDNRPEPDKIEEKKYVISQYPLDVIPLVTWENGKRLERDGELGWIKDYAINEAGPSEAAAAQIQLARQRGMKAVFAKADAWASWQYGTFPYLPFPYQWYARYQALEKYRIDGTMESWSYGFKPNWVAELRAWYSWTDAPPLDELLRAIARRDFGPGSEELVLQAWDHFSRAIRLVPDTGSDMGTNCAVAQPLFFEKPRQARTPTLEHSWTDQGVWMAKSRINPYWPYVWSPTYLLWPDFTGQENVAESYAQPFSLPVFNKYLLLAADEMEKGLELYRGAALRAPQSKRYGAFREVLLAEQLQRMMRSEQAVLEFENLRFNLSKTDDRAESGRILDRMIAITKDEMARTEASREATRRDSRLGSGWDPDYFYTPYTLEEKLELLRATLEEQIPAYRQRNNIP